VVRYMKVVDLTIPLSNDSPRFPLHPVHIERIRYTGMRGTSNVTLIMMSSHVGTHIDTPFHAIHEGKKLEELPLERFIGPGVVVDIPKGELEEITPDDLEKAEPKIRKDDIVIIHTGWAKFWGHKDLNYLIEKRPGVGVEAAKWLVNKKINIVGTDTMAVQSGRPAPHPEPVHNTLLSNNIILVECVGGDIAKVAGLRANIAVIPLPIYPLPQGLPEGGGDASPVRVLVLLEG